MARLIWRMAAVLALLVGLIAAGLVVLSRVDPRYRVSDWRVVLSALTGLAGPGLSLAGGGDGLHVADGYVVQAYAVDVRNARTLRLTPAGDLLVAQPRLGQILLLGRDANGDGLPDRREVVLAGRNRPYGMDFVGEWLYVAEGDGVVRLRFDAARGQGVGAPERILEGIPEGGNHWTRTLRAGPDGWIYVSIGSSCNVCIETHPWRASMIRFRPDGSGAAVYADGLRNSVGFDWAPWTGELFATDNGRDLLGDDFPPCELNLVVAGGFYGWPLVNGRGVPDPDFGEADPARTRRALPPAHAFRAHNAPLGMTFLRSPTHGERAQRSALVALHGSWNRSVPDGYRVVQLFWNPDGSIREQTFLDGFLRDGKAVGRPADVIEAADGTIYVSDDYAGAVYVVRRRALGSGATAATSLEGAMGAHSDPLAGIDAATRTIARDRADALMAQYGCAQCHVPGSALAARWTTLADRYGVEALADYFITPTPPMPVFPLSADDRRQLAIALLARQ